MFRYCELLPVIANARLFAKENKETFNASIVNEGVIQFGLYLLTIFNLFKYLKKLFIKILITPSKLMNCRTETSGKWPTELGALERVKAAFCLQISRGLRKKFRLRTKVNVDSVDIIKG